VLVFLIVVVGLLMMRHWYRHGDAAGAGSADGAAGRVNYVVGGHGTGAAWSKLFIERYGFENATEVAMACATFGLVLGVDWRPGGAIW
jgi:ESS family glutamate:Na+ symporter